MHELMNGIKWLAAAAAGLWGGVPELTRLLVILMAVDVGLGVFLSLRDRRFHTTVQWKGISVKMLTLVAVALMGILGVYVKRVIDVDLVQAASAFYIFAELTSIMRNFANLDVPLPPEFTRLLDYFKTVGEERVTNEPNQPERPA